MHLGLVVYTVRLHPTYVFNFERSEPLYAVNGQAVTKKKKKKKNIYNYIYINIYYILVNAHKALYIYTVFAGI